MERYWILLSTIPTWSRCELSLFYSFFKTTVSKEIFLQSVLVFLVILTSGLQYLVQRINYKRDLERIELIVGKAKTAAWGLKMVPVVGKRKVHILPFSLTR